MSIEWHFTCGMYHRGWGSGMVEDFGSITDYETAMKELLLAQQEGWDWVAITAVEMDALMNSTWNKVHNNNVQEEQ